LTRYAVAFEPSLESVITTALVVEDTMRIGDMNASFKNERDRLLEVIRLQ
jgi:hypothetical protein